MEVWIFFWGGSLSRENPLEPMVSNFFPKRSSYYLEQLDMGICESNKAEFLFWGGKGVG